MSEAECQVCYGTGVYYLLKSEMFLTEMGNDPDRRLPALLTSGSNTPIQKECVLC